MTTLFISDLHLDESRPQITRLFLEFLDRDASRADALYILGDLFEAWIGDDAPGDVGDQVANGLAQLHGRGVPCFFIHGNRDFLLGDAYARRAGMSLLPDPSLISLDGEDTLLMHGDTLCTDDARYQATRTLVRSPVWQRQFLSLPIEQRLQFAEQARAESRSYTRSLETALLDVNASEVERTFERRGIRRIIHGHTHRPAIHNTEIHGVAVERIVLADWHDESSALVVDGGAFRVLHEHRGAT